MPTVPETHKSDAPSKLGVYVVTCSSTRFQQQSIHERKADDPSGDLIVKLCEDAGHFVVGRTLLLDNKEMIQKALVNALALKNIDAVLITGGTGISPTDVTVEAVQKFIAKELRGFGELFRRISFEKIGASAMMSRATAGITKDGKAIFCLPGSPDGVETAMKTLVVPELPHVVKIARR